MHSNNKFCHLPAIDKQPLHYRNRLMSRSTQSGTVTGKFNFLHPEKRPMITTRANRNLNCMAFIYLELNFKVNEKYKIYSTLTKKLPIHPTLPPSPLLRVNHLTLSTCIFKHHHIIYHINPNNIISNHLTRQYFFRQGIHNFLLNNPF